MENINIQSQIYTLMIFIFSGISIGFIFDFFRILRKVIKTSDIITYIEDICFWIIAGLFLIFVIFIFQNGQIRIYNIIGIIIGFTIYILILSKYVIKISVYIIKFIIKILLVLKKIIIYPIKLLFKPIFFIVFNIRKFLLKKKIQIITKKTKKYAIKKKDFKSICRKIYYRYIIR